MKFSLSELVLRDMSPDEMRETYLGHMIHVFPENELKPCDSIYREMLENKYLACGLYAGEVLVGYVFTACIPGREQLFGQYVVVKEEYRSMGVGAVMMDKVMEHYSNYRCFMADVEDPEYPVDDEDKVQRERRMRFYTRNGFRRTRVKGHVYGVDYEVIVRDISAHPDDEEVFDAANAIYESMAYPGTFPEMFRLRLEFKKDDRGMHRREFAKLTDTSLTYAPVSVEGFNGIAGILDIKAVSSVWKVPSANGPTVIAAPGYTWLQLMPDHHKWWLTVMYNESNQLVQYYFDVIDSAYTANDGEPRFKDIFLDIVMSADGSWKLLDKHDLELALEWGAIEKNDYDRALYISDEIISAIDSNEPYWRGLCSQIIDVIRE